MRKYELHNLNTADKNINIFKDVSGCDIHTHEFVELVFIYSGTSAQYIDGNLYETREGDLLFINYSQTHSFTAGENFLYYNIEFTPDFFGNELINSEDIYDIFENILLDDSFLNNKNPIQKISFPKNEIKDIKKLILDMEREFNEKQIGYQNALNGYSRILFSKMLRQMIKIKSQDSETINKIVSECIDYVDKHCFGKLTLSEIAANTFYNPAYLSRIFKKYCNQNIWEYIRKKRIEEAGRLLLETECSIEDIMNEVGYSDKKNFYKYFKDIFRVTPAEYRKSK